MTESLKQKLMRRLNETSSDGPKRSLGQNFLISEHVVSRVLDAARMAAEGLGTNSEIIEIGPGLGALTDELAEFAQRTQRRFTVIELDRVLCEYWRSRSVNVIEADALQYDWGEAGSVGARAETSIAAKSAGAGAGGVAGLGGPDRAEVNKAAAPGEQDCTARVLVSNLPYQISSSLVIDRSVERARVEQMVLMFQKEVAKRISAEPSSADFGLLSVIAQLVWRIDKVSEAGPADFWPAPRVASRVLRFQLRGDAPDEREMRIILKVSKAAYAHRRKLLVSNLEALGVSRDRGLAVLERMGLAPTARAEELSASEIRRLSSEIYSKSE